MRYLRKSVDELTTRRNADVEVNSLLQELAWTDISEVLHKTRSAGTQPRGLGG